MTGDGKIIGYKIVSAETFEQLEKGVGHLMVLGWMPTGGVSQIRMMMGSTVVRMEVAQAMYLEADA